MSIELTIDPLNAVLVIGMGIFMPVVILFAAFTRWAEERQRD